MSYFCVYKHINLTYYSTSHRPRLSVRRVLLDIQYVRTHVVSTIHMCSQVHVGTLTRWSGGDVRHKVHAVVGHIHLEVRGVM